MAAVPFLVVCLGGCDLIDFLVFPIVYCLRFLAASAF